MVDFEHLTRFHESVDQALAGRVERFNREVEEAKAASLAILEHDLRTPLGAIGTPASLMLEMGELEEPHRTLAGRIVGSVRRAHAVGDLLDFTRSRLEGGIPVARVETSFGRVVRDVVDELGAAHPERRIRVDTRGAQRGWWDAGRLGKAWAT
ncbi:histidine kinase dimerization/phospho-acceptor domain-containing protein [Roseisolibacter sp. H3M3-2]|uniref:sensor histidine kinase n=1 Tax=Roseisolibacter sp. H3M3-2 TaxID=3031323 RepID=UPI0023DC1DCD|nr:histidine kinase dimerization/phospho-acceptor domain-containing protein [Roseisolibacter sp. H3M3-2]MDF1501364.1 hypothetical protein [Roseisolibacter sp. H3M3-2]